MIDFDPLTADFFDVWHYRFENHILLDDCDCFTPPEAHHNDSCSVTPIFAEVTAKLGSYWAVSGIVDQFGFVRVTK